MCQTVKVSRYNHVDSLVPVIYPLEPTLSGRNDNDFTWKIYSYENNFIIQMHIITKTNRNNNKNMKLIKAEKKCGNVKIWWVSY